MQGLKKEVEKVLNLFSLTASALLREFTGNTTCAMWVLQSGVLTTNKSPPGMSNLATFFLYFRGL